MLSYTYTELSRISFSSFLLLGDVTGSGGEQQAPADSIDALFERTAAQSHDAEEGK